MEEYDFEIQYIRGRDNVIADALSRITIEDLKNLYGETQFLAITRSKGKTANSKANTNNQNDIVRNNIHVFEDFNTGFNKKIPRLKTRAIIINQNGTTASIAIVYLAYCKLF